MCTRCTKFQGADSDTLHYLMVAKFREKLAGSKDAAQKCDKEDLISGS